MTIGIDVGTTATKVSHLDRSGHPLPVPNQRGDTTTPSVVLFPEGGPALVGKDACDQAILQPARAIYYPKRELGTTHSLIESDPAITATDAVTELLRAIKADCERTTGEPLTAVVATVPANTRDDARQALLDAFERLGISVVKLLPEPSAAALAYVAQNKMTHGVVVVYDLGGGTCDVSVLEVRGEHVQVLATAGVGRLGGNDISAIIKNQVVEAAQAALGRELNPSEDGLFYIDLENKVEATKRSLARQAEVPVSVAIGGQQIVEQITRDDFDREVRHLLQPSLEAMDQALADAGKTYSEVDRLVLVGGPSRMPVVQTLVADHTGLRPVADIDPELVVAIGAALFHGAEVAKRNPTAAQSRFLPNFKVGEVTAHDVGCMALDRSGAENRHLLAPVIRKNTPIPCRATETFALADPGQTAAEVRILQGVADADADECLTIGIVRLDELPVEDGVSKRIRVEYYLDPNGMVHVNVTDEISGKCASTSVDYKQDHAA